MPIYKTILQMSADMYTKQYIHKTVYPLSNLSWWFTPESAISCDISFVSGMF